MNNQGKTAPGEGEVVMILGEVPGDEAQFVEQRGPAPHQGNVWDLTRQREDAQSHSSSASPRQYPNPFQEGARSLNRDRVDKWSEGDVAKWLWTLGKAYIQYTKQFVDNGVDGIMLKSLTQTMLENDLHVQSELHRKKIILTLKKLLNEEGESSWGFASALHQHALSTSPSSEDSELGGRRGKRRRGRRCTRSWNGASTSGPHQQSYINNLGISRHFTSTSESESSSEDEPKRRSTSKKKRRGRRKYDERSDSHAGKRARRRRMGFQAERHTLRRRPRQKHKGQHSRVSFHEDCIGRMGSGDGYDSPTHGHSPEEVDSHRLSSRDYSRDPHHSSLPRSDRRDSMASSRSRHSFSLPIAVSPSGTNALGINPDDPNFERSSSLPVILSGAETPRKEIVLSKQGSELEHMRQHASFQYQRINRIHSLPSHRSMPIPYIEVIPPSEDDFTRSYSVPIHLEISVGYQSAGSSTQGGSVSRKPSLESIIEEEGLPKSEHFCAKPGLSVRKAQRDAAPPEALEPAPAAYSSRGSIVIHRGDQQAGEIRQEPQPYVREDSGFSSPDSQHSVAKRDPTLDCLLTEPAAFQRPILQERHSYPLQEHDGALHQQEVGILHQQAASTRSWNVDHINTFGRPRGFSIATDTSLNTDTTDTRTTTSSVASAKSGFEAFRPFPAETAPEVAWTPQGRRGAVGLDEVQFLTKRRDSVQTGTSSSSRTPRSSFQSEPRARTGSQIQDAVVLKSKGGYVNVMYTDRRTSWLSIKDFEAMKRECASEFL